MLAALKDYLGVAALFITVGGWIWVHMTSSGTKALTELKAFKEKVDAKHDELEQAIADKSGAIGKEHRLHSEAVMQRFSLLDLQIAKIEAGMEHLPDRRQAQDLAMAVERMSGQIAAMDAKLNGRIDTLDERLKPVDMLGRRIQEMLVRQAEKSA